MDIASICESMNDQIVAWRRDLHRIPEVGNSLPKTAAYIQNKLMSWGISFKT